jgi:hypoxanthine phosphoribosyltransferase
VILPADKIRKRVQELARQISEDFRGKTLYVVGVMENGFIFMADLVRELDVVPVDVEHREIEHTPAVQELGFQAHFVTR